MGTQTATAHRQAREPVAPGGRVPAAAPAVSQDARSVLLCLQRQAGNHSVGRLLDALMGKPPPEPGQPLDEATRQLMEARFGHDFAGVRLHSSGAAAATARDAGARAYTTGRHVVVASGHPDLATAQGRALLAHELAHVVQQGRGGELPPLDAHAPHESGADAAAAAFVQSSAPISVSGATGVGMARAVDDWLHGTLDLSSWGYTELMDERNELLQWKDRQLATDDRVLRIEEALALIDTRIRSLEQGVQGPQKPKKKAGTRGKKGRNGPKEGAAPASEAEPAAEPPRSLVEQRTIAFHDPDDMRREFDLIVRWLQRQDVSPADRRTLQQQLAHLAPLLGQNLQQRAHERRRARIGAALTPSGGGSSRASLLEAVRLVDSIRPVAGTEDRYYLMHGDEMLTLSQDEAHHIRAATLAELDRALKRVMTLDADALRKLEAQRNVDLDNAFAAWGVSLFTDMDTSDALDRYWAISDALLKAHAAYHGARRSGSLPGMATALADAEERAIQAYQLASRHVDDIQTTGAQVITGLQITQAAAFTIVMVATAGAAAPAIGTGLAGAGITGAGGTLLTAAGTATVVGAEGFVLGGTGGTLGGLARGDTVSDSLSMGLEEGGKWGRTGASIGAAATLAPALAARFGATAEGIGLGSQMLRTGAASGTVNLGVEAGSRALVERRSLTLGEAGAAFGGGFLGGLGGPGLNKIHSTAWRGGANMAWGGGTSGGLTYLQTGDAGQAWQSAGLGAASSLSLGTPKPGPTTRASTVQSGQTRRSTDVAAQPPVSPPVPHPAAPVAPAPVAPVPLATAKPSAPVPAGARAKATPPTPAAKPVEPVPGQGPPVPGQRRPQVDVEPLVVVKVRGRRKGEFWAEDSPEFKSNAGTAKAPPNPDYVVLPKSQATDLGFRAAGTPPSTQIVPMTRDGLPVESLGAGRISAGRVPDKGQTPTPAHPIMARVARQGPKGKQSGTDMEMPKDVEDPKAQSAFNRMTLADQRQAQGYRQLMVSGEYGLLRPGNVSTGGVDAITARLKPDGTAEVFLNDFTTPGAAKPSKATHQKWKGELDNLVRSGRVNFTDARVQAAVLQAIQANPPRVFVRSVRVDLPATATVPEGHRPGAGVLAPTLELGTPTRVK